MVTLEQQTAQTAQKASGSAPQEREVALEEQYVSGGEEELVFANPRHTLGVSKLCLNIV